MTPAEELQLAEQQIHTLNQAQKLYPVQNETVIVKLSNTKFHYWYESSDQFLDVMLDSIILHQSLTDDYIIEVYLKNELLFSTNITKECFDKIKVILDSNPKFSIC